MSKTLATYVESEVETGPVDWSDPWYGSQAVARMFGLQPFKKPPQRPSKPWRVVLPKETANASLTPSYGHKEARRIARRALGLRVGERRGRKGEQWAARRAAGEKV